MKKMKSLILALLLFLALPTAASAAADIPFISDQAQLLTTSECSALTDTAKSIGNTYDIDVLILTVDSLNGSSAESFADNYYYNGGFQEDGILLLLTMAEREWYIYTSGSLIYAFTDYDIQYLGSKLAEFLGDGDYYQAFDTYLDALPSYLQFLSTPGNISTSDVYYETESKPNLLLSLGIGILAAGITVWTMASSMNTKRKQGSASGYMQSDSFHLRTHQDLFLYSKVNKVRRQQNNTSGGHRSGTTVHRSSGGRRHGGGGGRF